MVEDTLRYDRLVEAALREVVREALRLTAAHGLPGEHHFYLTFRTHAEGVSIPDFLREQYPEEMTIVLQHQFWDLEVEADRFSITLSFKNRAAELKIPFAALTAFVDPSVKFALQFNADGTESGAVPALQPDSEPLPVAGSSTESDTATDTDQSGAEVVSLDHFRKK